MRMREPFDVVVAGGGTAGAIAAIAAARMGAKTLVIDQYGNLGGVLALGMSIKGIVDAEGYRALGGIGAELLARAAAFQGSTAPFLDPIHGSVTGQDPEALKVVLLAMAREAGVQFLFHTFVAETIRQGTWVQGLLLANKAGLEILPALTFVDCTGDADLVARAQGNCVVGRPHDAKAQPASRIFRMGGVDLDQLWDYVESHPEDMSRSYDIKKLRQTPGAGLGGFPSLIQQARLHGDYSLPNDYLGLNTLPNRREVTVNVTRVHDIDGTNPDDVTRAELETQRQMLEVLRFLRQYVPGFSNAYIVSAPFQVGIRETRHIQGGYTLTQDDVMSGRDFSDQIGRGAYPLDIHDVRLDQAGGSTESGHSSILWKIPRSYGIPAPCLIPTGVDNIAVGGRAISATHEAAGSVRGQAVCMVTGQAAGVMAALAAASRMPMDQVAIEDLQKALRQQDAILDRVPEAGLMSVARLPYEEQGVSPT